MFQIGLTGGIASGKSTVARMFAERGAVIVDADAVAREVVEPGEPALDAIVAEFGPSILLPDGTLDRDALAAVVFADPDANRRLREITHPAIGARMGALVEAQRETDNIVVLDAPLLVEAGWTGMPLVVVAADEDVQVERMVRDRAMTEGDARARIASQAPLAEKLDKADFVIWNNGTLDALASRVDEVWAEVCRLRDAAR